MNIISYDKYFEERGNQFTIYNDKDLEIDFVQDKVSKSHQGVIRGFHGDTKTWKLITCLQGKIKLITYNVDTDTKDEYVLDGDDRFQECVLVPPRFLNAHQCLSSTCIFFYKWSEYYTSAEEQWSVVYNDLDINPSWDMNIGGIISDRDRTSQSLKQLKDKVCGR